MSWSEDLAAAQVLDAEGRPRRLGELWAKRRVVLVFLRHFG
jgi:hypothetical protein